MKKVIMMITVMILTAVSADAMSYEQARREALFLTDKMAYELNLTDDQYEAAYEINLDYLMGVTGRSDVFGTYWTRRNLDLSYILLDWQYSAFRAATYFYRPLYWNAGYWHFGIYARYPRRDYFYFGRPAFYASYRGGHSWKHHGDRGYYYNRRNDFHRGNGNAGLRDRWDKGDFNNTRTGKPNSSTHVTVNNRDNGTAGKHSFGGSRTGGTFGGNSGGTQFNKPATTTGTTVTKPSTGSSTFGGSRTGGSFSGSRTTGSTGTFSRQPATGTTQHTGTTPTTSTRSINSPQMKSSATFGGASRSNSAGMKSSSSSMKSSPSGMRSGSGSTSGSSKGGFGGRR